jgi:hypothetical protein
MLDKRMEDEGKEEEGCGINEWSMRERGGGVRY